MKLARLLLRPVPRGARLAERLAVFGGPPRMKLARLLLKLVPRGARLAEGLAVFEEVPPCAY